MWESSTTPEFLFTNLRLLPQSEVFFVRISSGYADDPTVKNQVNLFFTVWITSAVRLRPPAKKIVSFNVVLLSLGVSARSGALRQPRANRLRRFVGECGWLAYLCFFLVFVCFIFPPLAFAPGKTNRLHYLPSCYSPLGVSARSVALRQPRANRLRRGVLVPA